MGINVNVTMETAKSCPAKRQQHHAEVFQRRFLGKSEKGKSWETEPRRGTGQQRGRRKGLHRNRERPSRRLHLPRADVIACNLVGFVEL